VKSWVTLVWAGLAVIFLAGCPTLWQTEAVEESASPDKLFSAAEESFDKKDYFRAIELYERLKSAHPDFKKMPEVYLKIADAFYNQKSYENAISRYLQFLDLYPNHESGPRAKYQIGMSYFDQYQGVDKDSRVILQAEEAFKALSNDHNAGEYTKKAEEKFKECRGKLAEKELYKAQTYYNIGKYDAARSAAKRVIEEFPKSGQQEEAQALLKKMEGK
jgi:outer membrane protein assembly factor BamD